MEQATIDRLGIFDEERFEEIVEHGDDMPGCTLKYVGGRTCEKPVTHRARCTTCRMHLGLICAEHADQVQSETREFVHPACGAEMQLRDLVEVSPL